MTYDTFAYHRYGSWRVPYFYQRLINWLYGIGGMVPSSRCRTVSYDDTVPYPFNDFLRSCTFEVENLLFILYSLWMIWRNWTGNMRGISALSHNVGFARLGGGNAGTNNYDTYHTIRRSFRILIGLIKAIIVRYHTYYIFSTVREE
jgi:hypothetical protein